jgi:hypothetical protein
MIKRGVDLLLLLFCGSCDIDRNFLTKVFRDFFEREPGGFREEEVDYLGLREGMVVSCPCSMSLFE